MASQVDGSTKNSNKRKFCPRMAGPKKIEALFCKFDSAGLLFNLADDAKQYVGSSGSNSSPNSLNSLCSGNTRHIPRIFSTLVKQKMIDTKRVPVQRNSLNLLLEAESDGNPAPMFWSCGGNTREALHHKLKDKLEANCRDLTTVELPCNSTVLSYNAALMSMHDVVARACKHNNRLL